MADVKLNSQAMALALAIQSAKGTAATAGFQTALLKTSKIPVPEFDVIETGIEHPSQVLDRSTDKTSLSERTGYLVPVTSDGFLYPRFFPMALIAAGFKCASTDMTGYFSHVLTIENDSLMKWTTLLYKISTIKSVLLTDTRFTNVTLTATPDDIRVACAGNGITQGDATGSEVEQAELKVKILPTLPTTGGWSFKIGAVELSTNKVRGFTAVVAQTLDEDDKSLWSPTRADMARDSIGVSGNATGINLDADIFEKTIYGGLGNTSPSLTPVIIDISVKWDSSTEVDTGVPYSVQMDMDRAELSAEVTDANEADSVLFSFDYAMIDDTATPVTFTVINDVAAYVAV